MNFSEKKNQWSHPSGLLRQKIHIFAGMKTPNTEEIAEFLNSKGVKPTANRILVVRELIGASHPLSLADLEESLHPMDKSAVFRVLEHLSEKNLLHTIDDGSRSQKFELCSNQDHHTFTDQHVHFYCENCKETFCFEDISVPAIAIPEGFKPRAINYVVKGLCPECAAQKVTG